MTNVSEKSRELLRQAEMRIQGLLTFSSEIDSKIFKLLFLSIAVSSALVFFLLNEHLKIHNKEFIFSLCIGLFILFFIIAFLLMAIKPAKYKGVGLPLNEFDSKDNLDQIIQRARGRYESRFNYNRKLNDKKSFWLKNSIDLLCLLPIAVFVSYLCLKIGV